MRFLIRMVPEETDRSASLEVIRGIAANLGSRAVSPKWTSKGVLEVDIFTRSRQDFEVLLAALEPLGSIFLAKDLQQPPKFLPKPQAIEEAVELFNAERFWEAHEVLESIWRVSEGGEKALLQGLILVCAAFVHHQKGENSVAVGVARRALPLLDPKKSPYFELDLAEIRERLERMVRDGSLSVFPISRRPGG